MSHEFGESFKRGQVHEADLDAYFGLTYFIEPATREQQRMGIDRIFTSVAGMSFSVEYKADVRAAETGNVAVETASVAEQDKPGWVYTSLAQVIVYYVPPHGYALWCDAMDLKRHASLWAQMYGVRDVPNRDYTTQIVAVPMAEFQQRTRPLVFPSIGHWLSTTATREEAQFRT